MSLGSVSLSALLLNFVLFAAASANSAPEDQHNSSLSRIVATQMQMSNAKQRGVEQHALKSEDALALALLSQSSKGKDKLAGEGGGGEKTVTKTRGGDGGLG